MFLLWYHSFVTYISFLLWKIKVSQILYPRLFINWKFDIVLVIKAFQHVNCPKTAKCKRAYSQGTPFRRTDDVSTILGNGRSGAAVWREQTLIVYLLDTINNSVFFFFCFKLNANISSAKTKGYSGIQQSWLACLILIFLRVPKDLEIYRWFGGEFLFLKNQGCLKKVLILRTMGQIWAKVARPWWILETTVLVDFYFSFGELNKRTYTDINQAIEKLLKKVLWPETPLLGSLCGWA